MLDCTKYSLVPLFFQLTNCLVWYEYIYMQWAHFPHIHFGLKLDGSKQAKLDHGVGDTAQKSNGFYWYYKMELISIINYQSVGFFFAFKWKKWGWSSLISHSHDCMHGGLFSKLTFVPQLVFK